MRFGIFSVVDHYPKELGRTPGELYAELLEQAEAADELGFDSFWIAEHHFHEYGAVSRPPDRDAMLRVATALQRGQFAEIKAARHHLILDDSAGFVSTVTAWLDRTVPTPP